MRTKLLVVVVALGVAAAVQAGAPRVLLHPDANAWTPFVEGDELVATGGGKVDWYRSGRVIAEVNDPLGLVGEGYDSTRELFVTDAEGNRVVAFVPGMELFLTNEPPAVVHFKQGVAPFARRGSANMTYHNGGVLLANKTEAVFWGHSWPTYTGDIISGMDSFFGGFGNSHYAGTTTQYYQVSGGTTQYIGAGSTYLGHYIDGSTAPSSALSTSQVLAEACSATGNNPDASTLYLVYTDTTAGNANYCAYHTWGTCSNGKAVQAAYMPNLTGVAGCDPGNLYNLSGSQGLRALGNVSAHELSEAITDPRGTAWYDRSGNEIGDKCAWIFSGPVTLSNGGVWQLQEEWSNAVTGCVQGQ
ncbi:MAG: hypothetical protein ACHQQS_00280 [Thermoanaerobaculales bacterium]